MSAFAMNFENSELLDLAAAEIDEVGGGFAPLLLVACVLLAGCATTGTSETADCSLTNSANGKDDSNCTGN